MINASITELPPVLSTEFAAQMLECEASTVEERCRAGELPGVKFGVGWVLPTAALLMVVNEIAMRGAAERSTQKQAGDKVTGQVVQITGKREPPRLPT